MKTLIAWLHAGRLSVAVATLAVAFSLSARVSGADQPSIIAVSLENTDVVVVVKVPAGLTKITLEGRNRIRAGAWAPRLVQRLDSTGGTITFRLPKSADLELLRVRADAQDALPVSFYRGTNAFGGAPTTSGTPPASGTSPIAANDAAGSTPNAPSAGPATPDRSVVESDIWNITGSTLYFFNQYRGLQVIDISQPQSPVVKGTLPLPAAGEQMYVLDANTVVLLAQNGCNYYYGSGGSESQVLVIKVANGTPSIAATLPVSGYLQESRLVGTALYVASQTYRQQPGTNSGVWEWGTQVSSFDLSNPSAPSAKSQLWYSGYGNVVMATDQFFFVSVVGTPNWYSSQIQVVDISAPDGTMKALATITPAGQVADKFKMSVNGDVFAVISQAWSDTRRWVTTLQTFSLSNPSSPTKLGSLELTQAAGEQLHATRFDGNLAYVVTFFQYDPLWVIDLSDPTQPQVKGKLVVPGWSTFIQPVGNQLVTVGIDNTNSWKVAVSLFNVTDPANPTLVSRVPLGQNTSWSEATYDEKAFNVLTNAGLILVPYQGYSTTNGYAARVQLIDLNLSDPTTNALTLRGTIDHQFVPRRATVYQNTILSISGQELLSVDASDRDHPAVRSDTALAWTVNRVFLQGNYLLEITGGSTWDTSTPPTVRVTSASDPDTILGVLTLTNGYPIVGSTLKGGNLYLAQSAASPFILPFAPGRNDGGSVDTNPPPLILTVVDLSQAPKLAVSGQTETKLTRYGLYSLEATWLANGTLVWSGGGNYWWPWLMDAGPVATGGPAGGGIATPVGGGIAMPIFWGGSGGQFFAFDVNSASAPKFLSAVDLTTNSWWSFSQAFTQGPLLYVSHQGSEFLPGVKSPYQTQPSGTNDPPIGTWVQRYYLDVIDYTDPLNPTVRQPVNIPGALNGVAYQGSLLLTVAPHWTTNWTTDWSDWLDASAYDGVSGSLVDSLSLSNVWPHPVLVIGQDVLIGRPDGTTNQVNSLETWTVSAAGKFTKLGAVFQNKPAQTLALFGALLAVQNGYWGSYGFYDATDPAKLVARGSGNVAGCIMGDLTHADGALNSGLWLPLGDYGVWFLPLKPAPSP